MQLGGLMRHSQPGNDPLLLGEGELGTSSPNQEAAELGWTRGSHSASPGSHTTLLLLHRQDVSWPANPARPGLFLDSKHAAKPDYFIPIPQHSFEQHAPSSPRVADPKRQEKASSPCVLALISRSAALIIDPAAGQRNLSWPC